MSATSVPAAAAKKERVSLRERLSNPWGRPRFLAITTWVYIAWSLIPVLLAIRFAFNSGRSRTSLQGWSLRWFWQDPTLSVFHDPTLRSALEQSLKLAGLAMLIATPLGVGLALGLQRWRGRGSGTANRLTLLPLVTPELVFAVGLFLLFTTAFSFIGLGTTAQVIGHVTFSVSFVVVIVRGRLQTIGGDIEEAAADLGAPPWEVVRRVLLPLLLPAIAASLLIVFALSIDDFVVSQYLASGADTTTVPMRIYAQARAAPTPALNALATLMLAATLLALVLAYAVFRVLTRGERGGRSALGQLASLEATIDAGGTK
ncbi:MAG TPA: ABC transporter permease subunit [Solirubrobacteraceae bacterium]|nr:ABC transporter permease subunit [Solirubrobacteraceae bacterium]